MEDLFCTNSAKSLLATIFGIGLADDDDEWVVPPPPGLDDDDEEADDAEDEDDDDDDDAECRRGVSGSKPPVAENVRARGRRSSVSSTTRLQK